ncbi:MAG: single-stranded DNA-binding protein [Bacteroidales bacterium]|nr:single-stranded DNA-binding protein [Bacteroidales bacterium]
MNSVQLVGRLTRDPAVRYTNSGMTVAQFTVACDRRSKDQNADFISCEAFSKTAEFIEKYFHKGQRIGLNGHIQTGSYQKDGQTVYTTTVVAENVEFVESRGSSSEPEQKPDADGFINMPADVDDDSLPFN